MRAPNSLGYLRGTQAARRKRSDRLFKGEIVHTLSFDEEIEKSRRRDRRDFNQLNLLEGRPGAARTFRGMPLLSAFLPPPTTLERINIEDDDEIPDGAVWLDFVSPQEDKLVERTLGIAVPTREEMQEIEVTSRLYLENGAHYMTATLVCRSDTEVPLTTPVTFILSGHRLTTVRYEEPKPFTIVGAKLARQSPATISGETVMMDLLDAVIAHAADILVKIRSEIDAASHDILEPEGNTDHTRSFKEILKAIGRKGDQISKVRESLMSIGRLLLYLAAEADNMKWAKDQRATLKGMQRDVQSLSDHAIYFSGKINFLLDALFGAVSLEQNTQLQVVRMELSIIKIFAVAAVVFLPPLLIGSIYGMNFKHMPELEFEFAYPLALMLMLFATIVPYFFFKWKKWL
jgi:magnesium transporter